MELPTSDLCERRRGPFRLFKKSSSASIIFAIEAGFAHGKPEESYPQLVDLPISPALLSFDQDLPTK
jgi:hypothetical protein